MSGRRFRKGKSKATDEGGSEESKTGPATSTPSSSPTAMHEIMQLRFQLASMKHKMEVLEDRVRSLGQDKEFLQSQLQSLSSIKPKVSGSKQAKIVHNKDDSNTQDSDSVGSYKFSDSSGIEAPLRKVKREKSISDQPQRMRMKTTKGVLERYKKALKKYKKMGSMKRAFKMLAVDRNTISRTAPIAELHIACPKVYDSIPPWDPDQEKMAAFAARCRAAITEEISEKITKMKKKSMLLPLSYTGKV